MSWEDCEGDPVGDDSPPEPRHHCDDCFFAYYKDFGYSNWTVEGTELKCIRRNRTSISAERFERIPAPDSCNDWKYGKPSHYSVDDPDPGD